MSQKKPLRNPFEDNEMFPYDKKVFQENCGQNAMLHAGLGMADLGLDIQLDPMLEARDDVERWLIKHKRYILFVPCAIAGLIDPEYGGFTDWGGGYTLMSLPIGEKPLFEEEEFY